MLKNILILLTLFSFVDSIAQHDFPKSWIGNYEGKLHIYTVDSIAMKIDMKLSISTIENDSIYLWKMTYIFNGNEDVRPYELKLADKQKGYYLMDEKNSIIIDSYFRNGILTSFFKVQDSFIISEYCKLGEVIQFDIIAARDEKNISGNKVLELEEIPEVWSFPINGRQEAQLFKIN